VVRHDQQLGGVVERRVRREHACVDVAVHAQQWQGPGLPVDPPRDRPHAWLGREGAVGMQSQVADVQAPKDRAGRNLYGDHRRAARRQPDAGRRLVKEEPDR
jgi:hypothetical protein